MAAAARKSDHSSQSACCCSSRRAAHAGPTPAEQIITTKDTRATTTPSMGTSRLRKACEIPFAECWLIRTRRSIAISTRVERIYFCSGDCLAKFKADPAKYLDKSTKSAPSVPEGTIYTCPMHPQIRQVGPGSCPICGMALEPVVATAEAGPNAELIDISRRFWIGLILSLPVVALEMGGHLTGLNHYVGQTTSNWVQMVLATPVVLWAGWPFFVRGWNSIVTRNLNMFTLIAMGTGVAWIYSMVATLAPGIFPVVFQISAGAVAVYFEAAAVITVLVLLGQVLELRARESTSGAIRALLDLAPKTARRLRDGGVEEEVSLDQVHIGDRLRVRPGEKVPVDGIVIEGRSAVDESMVTGDQCPSQRKLRRPSSAAR